MEAKTAHGVMAVELDATELRLWRDNPVTKTPVFNEVIDAAQKAAAAHVEIYDQAGNLVEIVVMQNPPTMKCWGCGKVTADVCPPRDSDELWDAMVKEHGRDCAYIACKGGQVRATRFGHDDV